MLHFVQRIDIEVGRKQKDRAAKPSARSFKGEMPVGYSPGISSMRNQQRADPSQLPEELKNTIDELKGTFRAKTHYEVIERLITYYARNEQQKEEDRKRRAQEAAHQEATMIELGEETKRLFLATKERLGLPTDEKTVDFLVGHFTNSDSMV